MNKRLIIIFACIAIFVLTLVVGAVVFSVSDVNILLQSEENVSFDKAKILETSGIKKGQSVFTINSEKASADIEKQFPKLKVVKIERVFPNKVRIHLDTRTAIFKINYNDKYAILDRELKIIDITNNLDVYSQIDLVNITGYTLNQEQHKLGDFVNDNTIDIKALKEVITKLEVKGVVNEKISATFESFEFVTNEKLKMKTALGITFVIKTQANKSAGEQCEGLYDKFCQMGSEREEPIFISYHETNGIVVTPNEPWHYLQYIIENYI